MERDEKGKFVKGHTRLGGRQKNVVYISDRVRKILDKKDKKTQMRYIDAVAHKIVKEALGDSERLLVELWHMVDGMPKQKVDVESEGGINININFTDADDER